MKTRLVWITPEAEKQIMYTARVSNPKNQHSEDFRLIQYLIENKHWSPLEMAAACFEIETSRRISPQILRHRSAHFQEFSQRYAEQHEHESVTFRRQDKTNRQNSIDDLPSEVQNKYQTKLKLLQQMADTIYREALADGIAKESAAFFLLPTAKTKLYMQMTIRDWVHYINLRIANGTQLEHTQIAMSIKDQLTEELPNVAKAVGWL